MWLFSSGGEGGPATATALLANDEALGHTPGPSRIGSMSSDGTETSIPGPGLYYVAISGFDKDPLSDAGLVFTQETRDEVSGPDGPGALLPHIGWTEAGEYGDYMLKFEGAGFVPEPGTIVLLAAVAVAVSAPAGRRCHNRNRQVAQVARP